MAWNRPSGTAAAKPAKKGGGGRLPLVGAAVVLVGAVVAFWAARDGGQPAAPAGKEAPKRTRAVSPQRPARQPAAQRPVTAQTNNVPMYRGLPIVKVLSCKTNSFGKEISYFYTSDGRKHCTEKIAYKPAFRTVTDDLISRAVNADPSKPMPPMPIIAGQDLDRKFLESLKTPIVISESDSEQLKEMKQNVIDARERMKELMEDGRHFSDVLLEVSKTANENLSLQAEAIRGLHEYLRAGDREGAEIYLQGINQALDKMGISPISMPAPSERKAEKLRRLAERRARAK